MKVRRPICDFTQTPAHWAPVPEFAQNFNASSLWIPHLERFLNRVMAKAAAALNKNDDPEMKRIVSDVRMFIKQEANHYALHGSFNAVLTKDGYDVVELERHFAAEFEKLLATRSLGFLCAYCEGFETMGPPSALIWLDDEIGDYLEGARPEVTRLWKWHLLEEYEHRTVCHDVLHAIHGGYFMRVYGFFYQLRQLTGFTNRVQSHLLARDREHMTAAELKASKKRERAVKRRIAWLMLPRLLKTLSPFYTPRKAKEPRMIRVFTAELEADLQ